MSHIILGMARGSKAADPAVRVLPGFLHMPELAVVLNQSHVEVLDGIQLHLYSWRQHQRGRTGVHPEHRFSLFRGWNFEQAPDSWYIVCWKVTSP